MNYHDPREFVRGLQQILISDSKRIGFLAGAGTSMVRERTDCSSLVPGTVAMTSKVQELLKKKYEQPIASVFEEIANEGKRDTLENLISKVCQKEQVVGEEKLIGLDRAGLKRLRQEIEEIVRELVSVHNDADFHKWQLTHFKFAQWVNDATRKNCIEIFTTNYDYLFEIAFEKFDIAYFDGFIGSYQPFFHSSSVEDDTLLNHWPKLWKIHGSLGWQHETTTGKIIKGEKGADTIVIYPSILKYDRSKKQPFASYLDRLGRFVRTEDSVLFITGYSFGDEHINDIIINGLSRSKNSSVIVFLYDDFEEDGDISLLAKNQTKLSIYGRRNAVIGGKFGEWKLKAEPSSDESELIASYFQRDSRDKMDKEKKVGKEILLQGNFRLVDFSLLVEFLSELNYLNYIRANAK